MMELTFYKQNGDVVDVEVSQQCYKRLAEIGISKKVPYEDYKIKIEGEEYSINAVELSPSNRMILLGLLEEERQSALEELFADMDEKPTIKEFREKFVYVRQLTNLYKMLSSELSKYLSYE